ncbi:MAG: hypothetical protein Q8N77_01815, partial [Nanoarchaeota archaeon]|nr:hypothetical protein [Nanoarchaeota archaeon]
EKIAGQKINKANELIQEAQKQITQGKLEQAKNTYKQAYGSYYQLPIEEQAHILFQIREIEDQVKVMEKEKEQQEIGVLAQELSKLKSERDVYVILDKKDITKKLDSLINYAQKVEKQGVHGIKAGKAHLKEKLKDISKAASKIEEVEAHKLNHEEKKFLTQLKGLGTFLQKERENLKPEPLIETTKVKMNIERWRTLQEEEQDIMSKLQNARIPPPLKVPRAQKEPVERYEWEIKADEVRNRRTRLGSLLREESKIRSKLRNL